MNVFPGYFVNIKKGWVFAPLDVAGGALAITVIQIMVCERGASFGTAICIACSLSLMRQTGCPVVYDATHSVQMPEGLKYIRCQAEMVPCLPSWPLPALPVSLWKYPDLAKAMSDGSIPGCAKVSALIKQLMEIDGVVKSQRDLKTN